MSEKGSAEANAFKIAALDRKKIVIKATLMLLANNLKSRCLFKIGGTKCFKSSRGQSIIADCYLIGQICSSSVKQINKHSVFRAD